MAAVDALAARLGVRVAWAEPEAAGPAAIDRWLALLDGAEQAQAARFHFAHDRLAYIAAHGLARTMLEAAGGLPAAAWRFVLGPHGRPEPDPAHARPWLRFNISHTRGLVCCAVAVDHDVGIDVEDLERRPVEPALARRYFAPCEAELVARTPPQGRQEAFLRIWTLKEAFVKATGDGVGLGLDRFAFELDPPRLRFAPESAGSPASWEFAEARPTRRHLMALAVRRRPGGLGASQ